MMFVCFSIRNLSSWDNFLKVSDSKVLNHSVSYLMTLVSNYFIMFTEFIHFDPGVIYCRVLMKKCMGCLFNSIEIHCTCHQL